MVNCSMCEFNKKNNQAISIRTKKGMLYPFKEYCQHSNIKHKEISKKAKDSYKYPIWCPIGEFKNCNQCGTKIRIEEGIYCNNCK